MNKRAGIVCDDYKLQTFKEELDKEGFTEYSVRPFIGKDKTSVITVEFNSKRAYDLKNLCTRVEREFKNKKKNG